MSLRMPSQAKRLLIELGSGAVLGGGAGYISSDEAKPAEKIDNVAAGAFVGAIGGGLLGTKLRKRRVEKLMRNMPTNPIKVVSEKFPDGKEMVMDKTVIDYWKYVSDPKKISKAKVKHLTDTMSDGPTVIFNGVPARIAHGHVLGIEYDAQRFGVAKAVQTAYGDMKESLISHGFKSKDAADKARRAIFNGQGRAVDVRNAKKMLASAETNKRVKAHTKRYLEGRIDGSEITLEIQEFTSHIPKVPPLNSAAKHIVEGPKIYQAWKQTLKNLEDPKFRATPEVREALGQAGIERYVSMNAPFGIGKIRNG